MAERRFSIRLDAEMNIGQVKTAVQQMQAELSKLTLPSDMGSKISGTFSKLTNEIERFQAMSAKGIGSTQDFNQLASSGNKIIQIYEQLANQVKSLGNLSDSQLQKLFPPSILNNITKATNAMEQYQNSMKGSKGQISELEKEIDKAKTKTAQLVSQKEKLEKKTAVSDTTFTQITKQAEEAKQKVEEAKAKLQELQNQAKQKAEDTGSPSLARKSSTYRKLVDNDIPAQEAELSKLEQAWSRLESKKRKALSQSQKDEAINNLIKDIQKAESNIEQLKNQLNQLKAGDGQAFQQLINQLNQINGIKLDSTTATIEDVHQAISKLSTAELEKLKNSFSGFGASVEKGRDPIQNFNSMIDDTRGRVKQLDQTMSEVDMLKSRANYFFGLTNSVFLFKRAITSALNTVKELDAVMTETAVVTDFTVGDMWDKLPEYSAQATNLGASIKDLYAATTLYYQQGLQSEAAMSVGIETMKMARIAGMDAAEATQAMTAALRGFNMEVNETNAQKVNDVYSELAAITAADTEQIATAMSKTASIAASANMEFETTSALLAQIIETTQEAPETAGTAMKTIIARFTEVKELFTEGMLTGEDSEGEEININKIDTALKTVGISLKDFLTGSKGIDDIFLELASKWDTLDLATQRYIATMAAGSRQQSRFIAMMSNYDRTMELVEAANNSAGASQQQFDKTLESMEAKLQKFSNAWNEFTMGLANNEILKGGVDLLTNLLETINNLTSAMSGGSGLLKSVTSLVTLIGALKLGKAAIGGGLGWVGSKMGMMNQGPIQETITTSVNDQGQTVNTIVRNPVQQGQQAGQQAGQGFVAGFKNAVSSGKAGNNVLEGFFTAGPAADVTGKNIGKKYKGQFTKAAKKRNERIQTKHENLAGYNLKQKYSAGNMDNDLRRDGFLGEIRNLNKDNLTDDQIDEIAKAYDSAGDDISKAMDNANAKTKELGGTLMDAGQKSQMLGEQANGLALNMGALGGAAMGVGATLGMLTQLFESLGMEDAAKATSILAGVFMGLGTVMMTLSSIAPLLGMSFTTAGIQITAAGVTSQLAWWWVFLIIAAVAALTIGIVALAKAAKAASLEGRMEAAAEATKDAQAAAEKAKTAYDDLLGAQESYNELQSTLEGLTKGTNEWKQALIEANSQVLQLLSTYPELAKYIGRGEDGQLTIDDEGWNQVIDSQYKSYQNSQRNVASSQIAEERLKQEKATLDLRKIFQSHESYMNEDGTWIMSEGDQISRESSYDTGFAYEADTMTRMLDAYRSIPEELFKIEDPNADLTLDSSYSEALQEIAAQSQYTAEELYGMKDALIAYDEAMLSTTSQMEGQAKAALTAGASQETVDYEYGDDIIEGFAKTMTTKTYENKEIEKAGEVYSKDGSAESETNQDFKDLAAEYKVTNEMVGDDLEDLKTLYAAMAGIAKEEIPEGIAKDKKRLAQEIGKMQASKEQADNMEAFRDKMEQLQLQDQKELASLISGNTSNLTFGELQQVQGKNVSDYASKMGYASMEEMAKEIGYDELSLQELNSEDQRAYLDKKIASGEITEETLAQYQNENGTVNYELLAQSQGAQKVSAELQLEIDTEQTKAQIEEAYNTAIGDLSSKTELSEDELGTMFADSSVGVIQGISEQVAGMSDDAAKDYINAWNNTIEGSNLGEAQKKQLENYLSSVDWSSMTEAVEAMDYMQSMGLDSAIIKNFWNTAVDGAKTYISSLSEVLSLTERLQSKMQNVDDIEKALDDGTATYEQMMELVNAGVDISNFQLTPEGWKATADEIEGATDKLREYNAEQARAMADQQKENFQKAQDVWNNSYDSAQIKQLATQNEDGSLVAGTIETSQQARGVAYSLGLQGYDAQNETYDAYIARIQAAYDAYINLLNNGEDITLISEKAAAMAEAARYTTEENSTRGGSDDSVRMSMQQEAIDNGLDPQEVTAYADSLRDVYSLEQQMADRIAIDNAKMLQGISELASNYANWAKEIKAGPGNPQYQASIDNLRKSVSKLLGPIDNLSDEWLTNKDNMALFKKASQGNTKAIEALRKSAAKGIVAKLNVDEASKKELDSLIDELAGKNYEIGTTLNNDGLINGLYDSLVAAGATADQIQDAFNNIGWEPQFETETYTLSDSDVRNGFVEVVSDPLTGATRKIPLESSMQAGATIEIPKIRGKNGSGHQVSATYKGSANATAGSANSGGGGGGGGGGGEKTKWENPYDEFYNVVEDINEELRTREKLERRYQALLDKTGTKASDLVKNARDQINSLEKQKKLREGLLAGRTRQMSDIESEYSDLSKYAWYNEQDGTIEIDWEKINALDGSTNEKLTSRIEEYIGKLEEQQDLIEQEEDELEAIEETLREIRDQGKDEYFDFEEQIKDALIDQRQKEIDKLSAINDSINDTNSRLIDAMQSSIDKYRQDRENERTEEELSDKQRRLAYLQQDTSGANALEIMQLQEEIDQGMEDYTDQLIDQKINELQEQNDEAAEQREKQIAIAEAQLKKWEESGEIWDNVYELMGKGMDDDGIIPGSDLQNLLKEAANFEGMSELQKMDWLENLENNVAQAIQWLMVGNSSKMLLSSGQIKKDQKITFTTGDGQTVTGTVQSDGTIKTDTGEIYKDVYRSFDGKTFYTTEDYIKPEEKTEDPTPTPTPTEPTSKEIKVGGKINAKGAKIYGYIGGEGYTQYFKDDPIYKVLEEKNGYLKVRWHKRTSGVTGWFKKSDVKAYKQGGLADFTGPAWLDGTKSKPEYILNAEQTKSFFELVDVLGSLKSGTSQSSQITGDSIYDVDINVESIGSDYDVEKLATTIKRMINDDARYRNNNAINLQR